MLLWICSVLYLKLCLGMYSGNADITELTAENFGDIYKNDSIWVVQFFTTWSCENCHILEQEFENTATILEGIVHIAVFNCEHQQIFCKQLGIASFPTIKIYGISDKSVDYLGKITSDEIVPATITAINRRIAWKTGKKSKLFKQIVIELTDATFDDIVVNSDDIWLVEFYSPACAHSKNFAPEWKNIAKNLKSRIKFAAIDGLKNGNKTKEYAISAYPKIKLFGRGLKSVQSVITYTGDIQSQEIIDWALDYYHKSIPIPALYQMIDEKTARIACEDKELCILAILPNIINCQATCRHEYLNLLQNVTAVYKEEYWGWTWFEVGSQPAIESLLKITTVQTPVMAVVNIFKKFYTIFKEPLCPDKFKEYLKNVQNGNIESHPIIIKTVPKINTTELWDGENAKLPQTLEDVYDKDEL